MVPPGPPTATPEPSRTLAPAARWQWRLEGLVPAAIALAGAGVLQGVVGGTLALLAWVAAVAIGAVTTAAVPALRWRRWRWEVREHEIDIRRGTLAITRTLVPMLRVQHVDTKRDLLQQRLGLATVVFHTAAGANEIPALTVAEAGRVRDRIAELARAPDDL
jgi:membrane protein YdbS with pleckstrin-like domain